MIEKFARVPPEKISKRDNRGLPKKSDLSELLSIPAAGMWAMSRYTTSIEAVIKSFLRISGDLTVLFKNSIIEANIFFI
jgi:hypothetical protein